LAPPPAVPGAEPTQRSLQPPSAAVPILEKAISFIHPYCFDGYLALIQFPGKLIPNVTDKPMANDEQLTLIKRGAEVWNTWRKANPNVIVDLRKASLGDIELPNIDLSSARLDRIRLRWAYLREARLSGANLSSAELSIIDLSKADLRDANLAHARLDGAYLREANLSGANLRKASLLGVDLDRAILKGANLEGTNLRNAVLVDTDLTRANLDGSRVYGCSVWNVKTEGSKQHNLIVTREKEPTITVDNLKLAQFVYLMINNSEIRDIIDTVTSKVVLILGRFTPERKPVLDAVRNELRKHNYLPVVFDFDLPNSKDTDETLNLLARMAKFVVADISDPRSVPQELKGIVEALPSVPVQPILSSEDNEYGMFDHLKRYPWVLQTLRYCGLKKDPSCPLDNDALFASTIIKLAETKIMELRSH
jgi:uncharacterized protein YjbI with pentapeptide repeats